jgi:hypothetical protein
MATTFLIVGDSGTGKSTSLGHIEELGIEGLNPQNTAIINVMDKPLPFKGSKSAYGTRISEGGNYAAVHDANTIVQILEVLRGREDIKHIIIDDWQYILAQEFMDKAKKKGFDKFTEIASSGYNTINAGKTLRPDQNFICMAHSEFDDKSNTFKLKTIGKLLDEKVNLAGLFTVILYTLVEVETKDGKREVNYNFVTNKHTTSTGIEIPAKSPVGMFDNILIPNDLGFVVKKANEYYQ